MRSQAPIAALLILAIAVPAGADLERVQYNHPGLAVDLGVGLWAWPLPMDYDGDGDLDLVVSCPDVPYNGTYFFENPGGGDKMPIFKPGVRIGAGHKNIQISEAGGGVHVLLPARELDPRRPDTLKGREIHPRNNIHTPGRKIRANQWKYVDYDGDGRTDLAVGVGDWTDYGWDNAFDREGKWTRGPLHGYVYILRNTGTSARPEYADPFLVMAGDRPVDVFGMPSPSFADFDGDGDLDLLCGEFLDRFTYFQNVGTRMRPRYAPGRFLTDGDKPMTMDLEMIVPTAVDWDRDGDVDLIVGQEDGRVALVEHTGKVVDGLPQFLPPKFFRQEADEVKFGALVTPWSVDWDGDGDEDLVCGNTAGYIGFIENLGGFPPKWAEPVRLDAEGKVIRIQAGCNGSIQGPCEAKWGYTTVSVADWDGDGLLDIVANSIWGKVVWFRNVGGRGKPALAGAQPVEVAWPGALPKPAWNWWTPAAGELVTQWRTTPVAIDLNRDGLTDLVMLDHEGYLAFFERERRDGRLLLLPGRRIFRSDGPSAFDQRHGATGRAAGMLRLNSGSAGGSGRRKLCFADWDGDGKLDLLVNSVCIHFLRNVSASADDWTFHDAGQVDPRRLAGHTSSPTVVDWDRNGLGDLLVGAEDGYLYYLPNPRAGGGKGGAPAAADEGDLAIGGSAFRAAALEEGGTAFGNRPYVWKGVPKDIRGWRYTQTDGGVAAKIAVSVRRDGTLHAATALSQPGANLTGWEEVKGLSFRYTDKNQTVMTVFRRNVKAGETVEVPQGNWSGTIVLWPKGEPGREAKE